MPERPTRSPFGSLLVAMRESRGLTRRQLADRTRELRDSGVTTRAVSDRTILDLESESPARHGRSPHASTVRALALALDIEPASPEFEAFVAAARGEPLVRPAPPDRLTTASDEPDAEFVPAGHEPHLARLAEAVDAAVAGTPGVMFVSADPGTGKTRLIAEACRRASARHPDLAVLWTECFGHFGYGAPYDPFRTMISQMLREPLATLPHLLPSDLANRLDPRVPVAVTTLINEADALVGTLAPSAAIGQAAAIDETLRERVRHTVARRSGHPVTTTGIEVGLWRLLARYAEVGPVIVILEDLHDADDATNAALDHVIGRLASRNLPLLVIGSLRPGEMPDRAPHDDTATLAQLVDVVTERFPAALLDLTTAVGGPEGRAFTEAVVARFHPDRANIPTAELFERTHGHPLFLLSYLRAMSDEDGDMHDRPLPNVIESVFAWQLSRLDETSRRVLDAASVQGNEFQVEPLTTMVGLTGGDVLDVVNRQLQYRHRLVYEHGDIVIADQVAHRFRFRHALLRDFVYGSLTDLQRSHLHRGTAQAMVERFGDRNHGAIDTIALHFEHAGDAVRAAKTWIDAGNYAMERGEFVHSRAVFQHIRAMGLAHSRPGVHIQALIGIGNSERGLGHPRHARAALQEARLAAHRLELHSMHANALTSLGVLDFDRGDMQASAERLEEAIAAHLRADDIREAGRSTANLSLAQHGMGRYDEAANTARRAIAMAMEVNDATVLASAEIALGNCWMDLGYYDRAIGIYAGCLLRCDALDLTHRGNVAILNIALCHLEMAQWDEAQTTLDAMLQPGRKPIDRLRAVAAFNGGLVAEGQGDIETAGRRYELSREIRIRIDQAPVPIDSLAGLLRIAIVRNDIATVHELIEEIDRQIDQRGLVGVEHPGRLFVTRVDAHQLLGESGAATRWLAEGIAHLNARAVGLADPDHRRSFVSRPPAHRRLGDLARRHGLPAAGDTNAG